MDNWLRLLQAAAAEDREACIEWSLKLGYLTGEESQVRLFSFSSAVCLFTLPHLSPSLPPSGKKDNVKRTHILSNPPRNPLQPLNPSTLLIWSRQQVVGNHS